MVCMGEDRTLVRVVHHEGFLSNGGYPYVRDGSVEVEKVFVDALPKDVLRDVFLSYHIASYLGNSPWLINAGEDYTHLHISGSSEGSRFMKYVGLGSEEFYGKIGSAKREQEIVGAQRIEMAEGLLQRVDPETGVLRFSFHSEPNARVYSDILEVLGFDVSFEQIDGWLSEIVEREHWEDFGERVEQAQRLNGLMGLVVGAEVL